MPGLPRAAPRQTCCSPPPLTLPRAEARATQLFWCGSRGPGTKPTTPQEKLGACDAPYETQRLRVEQETPASKQRKQWVENPQGSGHAAGAGVTQRAGCSARGKPSPMLGSKAGTGAQPCPFGAWIGPSWLQEAGREGQDCSWSVSAKGQEEGMRLRKPVDTGNQRRGTNRVQMLQAKNASGSREQSEEGHAMGRARGT